MDQELDRAIDAALDEVRAVKPSPHFLPRLRTHIEEGLSRAPVRWWIPFAASASALAAGAIVAALVRTPRTEAPLAMAMTPRPVLSGVLAPVVPGPPAATRVGEAPRPRSVRADRRAGRDAPDAPERTSDVVLVPPGQLAAIGRLLDAINAGDEPAASRLRRLGTDTPIVIEPIQIEPVAVPPLKESM